MATKHLLDGEGAVLCTAAPLPDGSNTTSLVHYATCDECLDGFSTCVGCYSKVRSDHPTDHARGCPTGQNGTPNYE